MVILGPLEPRSYKDNRGACLEPKACGSLESFRKEDPKASSCLLGSDVSFAPSPYVCQGYSGGGGSGYAFSPGAGTTTIREKMWEFISSEITRIILGQTPMIFGSV